MENIDKLLQICPAPQAHPSPSDWVEIEKKLGVSLPSDYKMICDTYGPGVFISFIHLFHPKSPKSHTELFKALNNQQEILREIAESPYPTPYPIDYKNGGLFPFAVTENGDIIYWLTTTNTSWPLILGDLRGDRWHKYEFSLSSFLSKIMSKQLRTPIFPDDIYINSPCFKSYT